jgi:ADP-ribosylglycohydrolase
MPVRLGQFSNKGADMKDQATLRQAFHKMLEWMDVRDDEGVDVSIDRRKLLKELKALAGKYSRLAPGPRVARNEPNELAAIRAARPAGPRKLWRKFDPREYARRLKGALLGRCAGCTLGAPVEGSPVELMEKLAEHAGMAFPPTDYWRQVQSPWNVRYGLSRQDEYTRSKLRHVPVDDDITYTLLGLLILEDHGIDFTTADVGKAWLKYLPVACTAEKVALANLRAGVDWKQVGLKDNPYVEWIGADIRSDPWGYAAPAWPEKAAELAYRDAYISHRHGGIYGEMYFAAAIAAGFAVDDPLEACRIALSEIPRRSRVYEGVRWALDVAGRVKDYRHGRKLVDEKFPGMHIVHTVNNAALTIFGLALGGTDVTKVIGNTVAMGLDNDCTAATAGSIVGAVVGAEGIPAHWSRPFHNKIRTYMKGREWFAVPDVVKRFGQIAGAIWQNS